MTEKKEETVGSTRIYMSKAYLSLVEKNLYGLFRDLLKEELDSKTLQPTTEKLGKPLGPLGLFRAREGQETKDMVTVNPKTGEPLELTCISRGQDPKDVISSLLSSLK